jgi:hypothetical protein
VPWSIRRRPAKRIDISLMESMRGCHRTGRQTQPLYARKS